MNKIFNFYILHIGNGDKFLCLLLGSTVAKSATTSFKNASYNSLMLYFLALYGYQGAFKFNDSFNSYTLMKESRQKQKQIQGCKVTCLGPKQ